MNKLDFNGGAYRCEVVEGAIFEGNACNLVAHFATDTITLHDRATRSAVSILSSRTENLQINGSVVSFEQAQTIIENAIKQGGGGGGGASWGSITGTLSSQTDLQSALDAKANSSAIPTKVSDLTNDSGFITSSALSGYQTAIPNVPSGATTGKFAAAVSQTNGQISVTYQGMDRLANSNQAFTDDDYVVRGTSTGAFQKSRFSLVWNYIKSKITTWCGIADDNQPVCSGNSTKLTIVKVAELPASLDPNTIYLISE